jgi:hypothetical protein
VTAFADAAETLDFAQIVACGMLPPWQCGNS